LASNAIASRRSRSSPIAYLLNLSYKRATERLCKPRGP
jgi:hypothetical protein